MFKPKQFDAFPPVSTVTTIFQNLKSEKNDELFRLWNNCTVPADCS